MRDNSDSDDLDPRDDSDSLGDLNSPDARDSPDDSDSPDELDLPDFPFDGIDRDAGPGFFRGLGQFRGFALLILPIVIAGTVWFVYQASRTDGLAAGTGTGAVSAGASVVAASAASAATADPSNEAGRPEGATGDDVSTGVGEFSSSGPVPVTTGESDDGGTGSSTSADPAAVPTEVNWVLGTGGATSAKQFLPLIGFSENVELPNYDEDRNEDPGLTIQVGSGLDEQDSAKVQRWLGSPGDVELVVGRPTVDVWVATTRFDTGKSGRIVAGLYECADDGDDCNILANGNTLFRQSNFGADFGRVSITMSQISATIGPDRVLQLTIAVPETSEDDLWIAFGTTTWPSRLAIR